MRPRWTLPWCGALGLAGSTSLVLGASRPDSPFTSKIPGSWFFGVPSHPTSGHDQWIGLLLTYAGLLLLVTAWYCVVTFCHPPPPIGRLWVVLGLWTAPLLIAPPLFSRDVYAYAAEGQQAASEVSPYAHTLTSLGRSPFLPLVDPLWRTTHAPYGPLFLDLAAGAVGVARHHVVGSVEGLRLVAVVGILLIGIAIVPLARSFGQDPSRAFALALLNPLVLVYLVGGAHNDALMLGLLVSGIAVARARHPVVGILLCSLAGCIKAPALIGVVYVAWTWAGPDSGWYRRCRLLVASGTIAVAVMVVVSLCSGYGWGWLTSPLSDPGKVVSWLDPATAVGLAAGHLLHLLGTGSHTGGSVLVARWIALAAALAIAIVLLLRSERTGIPVALGWSLLALALLGPVVWPWYETWGIVFLAVAANTLARRVILILSAVGCFATVPSHLALTTPGAASLALGLGLLVIALLVFVLLSKRGLSGAAGSGFVARRVP